MKWRVAAVWALACSGAWAQVPEHKLIDQEVNMGKQQVYLRVELKAAPKGKDVAAIEKLCASLDTHNARKFVVFVHLPGKAAGSAYASCGRLPNGRLEARVF